MCIASLLFLYSCNTDDKNAIAISVVVDKTDTLLALPDKQSIVQRLQMDDDWEGRIFRAQTITDVYPNPVWEVSVNSACVYLSNLYDRERVNAEFESGVDTALKDIQAIPPGRNSSSIYISLSRELWHLHEINAKRKVLVVYSDLMEFSSTASFYDTPMLEQLNNNPQLVQQKFEKVAPLPDLRGIEVFIIFQPKDKEESQQFDVVSEFYRSLLQSKGARVSIMANLVL